MPIQTTQTGYVKFKDGAKVEVKKAGGAYVDIGALGGDISLSLEYTENVVESANAGTLLKQIKQMKANGSFPLININPTNLEALGGGLFTQTNTAGSQILAAAFTDQAFTGFVANTKIPLVAIETATGLPIKFSAAPTITSVTGSGTGASGVLAANDDYTVIVDASSASGYSMVLNTAGSATVAITETITIVYGNNTPVARTTLSAGNSTKVLTAYSIKFTHTDSASKIRSLEIFSANTNSGGFVFNFGGANSDGVEEMPISFTGSIDTTLTDGAQLLAYIEDVGAA
jgi:hypothetical protein